jgi:hypothetical protein
MVKTLRIFLHRLYAATAGSALLLCALFFCAAPLCAETIPVRHVEGVTHGFLVLNDGAGKAIAYGDMIQDTKHGLVTSRLTFHFKDGSLYEEATVFSEHGIFRVLSDHLIEEGPVFKQPIETWLNTTTGRFRAITTDKGKKSVVSKEIQIPDDLANGIVYVVVKNIDPKTPSTTVSMLVGTPKPRIIKLVITPQGQQKFDIGDLHRAALHYVIKFDLGGIAGAVAPVIGKQPANMDIWIASDGMPTFLMSRGELFEGGPIWTISLTTPRWVALAFQSVKRIQGRATPDSQFAFARETLP